MILKRSRDQANIIGQERRGQRIPAPPFVMLTIKSKRHNIVGIQKALAVNPHGWPPQTQEWRHKFRA